MFKSVLFSSLFHSILVIAAIFGSLGEHTNVKRKGIIVQQASISFDFKKIPIYQEEKIDKLQTDNHNAPLYNGTQYGDIKSTVIREKRELLEPIEKQLLTLGTPKSKKVRLLKNKKCQTNSCKNRKLTKKTASPCRGKYIVSLLRTHFSGISHYWQEYTKKTPTSPGKIIFRWVVDSEGRAKNIVLVKDTVNRREIRKWAVNIIRDIKFDSTGTQQCTVQWHLGFGTSAF